jgi:hypothetical protein
VCYKKTKELNLPYTNVNGLQKNQRNQFCFETAENFQICQVFLSFEVMFEFHHFNLFRKQSKQQSKKTVIVSKSIK